MIRFFNTMGREFQEFHPIKKGEIRMYTCGPTVYNYPHIGNYRTFIFEDLLRRFLKYKGYKVTQVMNLTDVEDRIIKICKERNLGLQEFTGKYVDAFFQDLDYLKFERAEFYPKATDHVNEMVKIINRLVQTGYAYRSEDGSIYYKISKFPSYGKLSGLKVSDLKAGARVKQDDYTKDAAEDFALWKAWDEADGKIFWENELGKGRPGWHIECSAMSMKYLGEEFDIHTGGVDNIFPHHENEIAQSEAYTGKKFARFWLHAEHLLIKEEKMAKRAGNIITVSELREKGVKGGTIRFLLLSGQYRTQLNFTEDSLRQAESSVKRINEFASRLETTSGIKLLNNPAINEAVKRSRALYVEALENDLDTPKALAAVFEFITLGNKFLDQGVSKQGIELMQEFLLNDFNSIFAVIETSSADESLLPLDVKSWLDERKLTRASKNWKEADRLREKLLVAGIEVQDTPQGQKWRRIRKTGD